MSVTAGELAATEALNRIWKALDNHAYGTRKRPPHDSVKIVMSSALWNELTKLKGTDGKPIDPINRTAFGFAVWTLATDGDGIELVITI